MIDSFAGEGMTWDYAILDEGHIVKNSSTKLSKAMALLRSNHRLLLTGTPVQNSLTEVGLSCTILSYHIHLYLIHGISFGRSLTGSPRAPYSAPSLTSPVGSWHLYSPAKTQKPTNTPEIRPERLQGSCWTSSGLYCYRGRSKTIRRIYSCRRRLKWLSGSRCHRHSETGI